MKLVLRYGEQVRLYTNQLTYQRLFEFVEREFQLLGRSIEMSFMDQEGDAIVIASEDDITIIQSYFIGKSYVKLTVKGEKDKKKPIENEGDDLQSEEKTKVNKKKKSKRGKDCREEQRQRQQLRLQVIEKKEKKAKHKKNGSKLSQIVNLLSATVAEIVDERLRAMIPCLREQLSMPSQRNAEKQNEYIHEGFQCSICFFTPIKGIRYECPKCDCYTICEHCESSNEHQHNLLKIRKPMIMGNGKQQKNGGHTNRIDELCKLLLDRTDELSLKRQKEEVKKKQQKAFEKENSKQAKRYLSQLFGNEPKSFNDFVKVHKKMSLEQIIKEYAKSFDITEDELYARVVDLQCSRLANKFKKEAEMYRDFVKDHFSFDLQIILKKIYSEGMEKKEKKKEKIKPGKELEEKPKEASLQKESAVKKESFIEKKGDLLIQKKEKKEERVQMPIEKDREKEQAKPRKESSQLKGLRQETLRMMVQFYGKGRQYEYVRFIIANQRYGKENIVQMWADQQSVISP